MNVWIVNHQGRLIAASSSHAKALEAIEKHQALQVAEFGQDSREAQYNYSIQRAEVDAFDRA